MSIKNKIRDLQTDTCKFEIYLVEPLETDEFKLPYILALPEKIKDGTKIIVESNNRERDYDNKNLDYNTRYGKQFLIENAINEVIGNKKEIGKIEFAKNLDAPIMMPVIPAVKEGIPYYQQLSKRCLEIKDKNSKYYRIDEQLCNMIIDVKNIIKEKGVNIANKIFLTGYSSSGIFAQRFAFLHPEIVDTALIGGAVGTIPMPIDCRKSNKFEYPLGTKDYKTLTGKDFDIDEYKKIRFQYYMAEFESIKKSTARKNEFGHNAPLHDMSYMERSVPSDIGNEFRDTFEINLLTRFKNQLREYEKRGYNIKAELYNNKTHTNGLIQQEEFENIYNGSEFSKKSKDIKRIQLKEIYNIIKIGFGQILKKIRTKKLSMVNNKFLNEDITDYIYDISSKFEYMVKDRQLDKKIEKIRNIYEEKLDENESIYEFPLQTKLNRKQITQLTRSFFTWIDPSLAKRAENIISGITKQGKGQYIDLKMYIYDKYSKYYQTKYDINDVQHKFKKNSAQTEIMKDNSNDLIIDVPLKGDLRDLYALVHEISHSFDTKNGDTQTRSVLGEVIPQVMERNLDCFLTNLSEEDKKKFGIDNATLEKDIKNRKITTFISRYDNVKALNRKEGNKIYNIRYMLAQIYQTQFMKLPINDRNNKIKSFLRAEINDDFEESNKSINLKIDNYWYQDMYISNSITEFDNIFNKVNSDENKQEKHFEENLIDNQYEGLIK